MSLFDDAGRKRIEATIAEVERSTAAEIAVVTVPSSDRYHDVRAVYAATCALTAAAGAHLLWPALGVAALLWLQVGAAGVLWLVLGFQPLLRQLLPAARAHVSVVRHAHVAFLQHEVFATQARTGVLLLLSELERRVVILGDVGIHAHVQDDGWRKQVDTLVAAIRAGRAADGTCEVIRTLGTVLAQQLPAAEGKRNELSNTVHEDRD